MTALAGFWSFEGREPDREVSRILAPQSIYGRQLRQWSGGNIALGRNLFGSLPEDAFDLAPQVAIDGGSALVADVRLDNRQELARGLGIPTQRLHGLCDAALLHHAIEAWGEGAVGRLLGDFAFAYWNSRDQSLLLARDFAGQRPLHFHHSRGFFAFASMPRALHAVEEVPSAPNHEAVAAFLALMPETGTESFFEGIEKVPAGHLLTVTRAGRSLRRYWSPPAAQLRCASAGEYEEALRAELDRAVAARLRGAGSKIASHLSGGLDSSAVTSTAARAFDGTVIAYTAVPRPGYHARFTDRIADESSLAGAVAARFDNVVHKPVEASGSSPLEHLDHYFHAFDRPVLNLCNGTWFTAILSEARADGLPILLTGQSGNASFSYDGLSGLSQMLRQRQMAQLVRTTASLLRGGVRVGTIAAQLIGPYLPDRAWRLVNSLRGKGRKLANYTLVPESLEPSLSKLATKRGLDFAYRPRTDPVEARGWMLQRVDAGNYNKGVLGGWGIDIRHPAADRRLVELCLSIPAEEYLAGGVPRSLARRAFADRLPEAVRQERRKGYQAADWYEALTAARREVSQEAERISRVAGSESLLDIARMRRLIYEWPTSGWQTDRVVEQYRLALLRGISAGHFLRKASGSNA